MNFVLILLDDLELKIEFNFQNT